MPTEHLDATAKTILDAATKRFLHYGYGKTTMSEIAGDCNMSTGNLYRYFPSKLDIAETFARVLRTEHLRKLRESIADAALSPQEALRALLRTKFRLAYERWHARPKALELSTAILKERPEFAVEWEESECGLIREVLQRGVDQGVFPDSDIKRAARAVQDAVFRFSSHAVFHEGDASVLSKELEEVIDLILDAFAWRARVRPIVN
jgi:AcrR family transcriptional regulator